MRNVTYKMKNGTVVNTYAEALAMGGKFEVQLVDIPEPLNCNPKQLARRRKAKQLNDYPGAIKAPGFDGARTPEARRKFYYTTDCNFCQEKNEKNFAQKFSQN